MLKLDQKALALLNVGDNLDQLMNLDPRGYGVCRILYAASRKYTGSAGQRSATPLTVNAAEKLVQVLRPGDLVYIMSGFVLLPHKHAETDGIVGAVLLARALVLAFDAKPVIVCPSECLDAVRSMSCVAGLHVYDTIEELCEYPAALAVFTFTKDRAHADAEAEALIVRGLPKAVIATECAGANALGVYHNAVGVDVTELEAKTDVLFALLQKRGVLNIAIGDLGNETGMGTLLPHLEKYIPYAAKGRCSCACGGGLAAATTADNIITATVSDWGCYGLIAAIAYLKRNPDILHTSEMEKEVLTAGVRSGLVDMYGWMIPAIDGFALDVQLPIVDLMRVCIAYPLKLETTCKTWFDKVLELGFFK
jgi:hypothetical protein